MSDGFRTIDVVKKDLAYCEKMLTICKPSSREYWEFFIDCYERELNAYI